MLIASSGQFDNPVLAGPIVGLGIMVVGCFIFLITAYRFMPSYVQIHEYWIEGTTLRINHGIIFRVRKSIPLDRVTDVQLVQGPLMRACGIWSLHVQTAGSADNAPEGTITGARDPETVRDTIMEARDQAALRSGAAT